MATGGFFPGVKRQGREADHSPPTSAEVKKMWESGELKECEGVQRSPVIVQLEVRIVPAEYPVGRWLSDSDCIKVQ
jgi:hypothetical protein